MQYLPKVIVGLVAAVQLAAVALPSPASAEQLKKIAILPKTLVNDVFQIRIVKAAEGEAKKDGIATETFASRNHAAIEDQINIIETLIARGEFGALIVAAVDSKGLGNVLDKAAKAVRPGATRDSLTLWFRPDADQQLTHYSAQRRSRMHRMFIGMVLTGMLDDGTAGLIAINKCGGITVVQDPKDAALSRNAPKRPHEL